MILKLFIFGLFAIAMGQSVRPALKEFIDDILYRSTTTTTKSPGRSGHTDIGERKVSLCVPLLRKSLISVII